MLGYKYRACIKLGVQQLTARRRRSPGAYQRHCVDLRDLRLVGRFDYFQVPPSQLLWIWEDDLEQAAKTSTSDVTDEQTPRSITAASATNTLASDADQGEEAIAENA